MKIPEIKEVKESEIDINAEKVPAQVRQKVIAKLSEMTDIPAKNILPDMLLAADLGIDSLDAAELAIFLDEQFEIKDVPVDELTSVKKVLGVASRQILIVAKEEMAFDQSKWKIPEVPHKVFLAEGSTLEEIFLKTANRLKKMTSCGDQRGILTYKDLTLRVVILAEYLKKLEGGYIGIMLPASSFAMILVFAIRLAGKIPVMINWTLGPRHVNAVLDATHLKVCLSSWSFLDRLTNVDLGRLVDCMVQLEDLQHEIGLTDKLKAVLLSKIGLKPLLKRYQLNKKSEEDVAVVLFTSGSEGAPKGVPLSHKNILSNLKSVIKMVDLYENDIFLSILPPFHSFGFTICGIAPMLLGIKAFFYPNPTEGAKLAKLVERSRATLICGAPTFLKNIFKFSTPDQLKSSRLIVTGAEKAPEELYDQATKLGIGERIIEGYGITECSPVLTINRPDEERKGVGRPLPDVELDVINPETHEQVGLNEQGLILAHGPNIFSGYLDKAIDPFVKRNGKKWYITGDLGVLDEKGRLTITGRIKRFVKVGPEMVSLGSIEEVIQEEIFKKNKPQDADLSVACCAREMPGEKPKFYLFTNFPLTVEDANVLLKKSGFSNLVRIHFVLQLHKLPLMGSGKVNYQQLEREFMS